jgi:hypothetical protein
VDDGVYFHVVLVFRPEAVVDEESVFSGIEVLGITSTEKGADQIIDLFYTDHPEWKFSMERVPFPFVMPDKPGKLLPLFDSGKPELAKEIDEMFGSGRDDG